MTSKHINPALEEFKPDAVEAAARWEAYWHGEIIDRPIILASCTRDGYHLKPSSTYYERVLGKIDEILGKELYNASATYYAGEQMPAFWVSLGADEIAAYCGGNLEWNSESNADTNWSHPYVNEWEESLPLTLNIKNPLYMRLLELYERAVDTYQGKILLFPIDFHTNMDLLLSVRGAENLCIDVVDRPELIDRALENSREVFKHTWEDVKIAGRMGDYGFWFDAYSPDKSVCVLACDFSCMIGKEMFRRWVLPTLEFEASLVDHVIYHWDGPAALRHFDDLMSVNKIHTISYVPDPFEKHTMYIDLYKKVQASGKGVVVSGTIDEMNALHAVLDPARTIYKPEVSTQSEIDSLIDWFVKNT